MSVVDLISRASGEALPDLECAIAKDVLHCAGVGTYMRLKHAAYKVPDN